MNNRRLNLAAAVAFSVLLGVAPVRAQEKAPEKKEEKPGEALTAVLVAACRQNGDVFAQYQTSENAEAFAALPATQRAEVMKRFVQVGEAGRPLLTNDPDGRTVVRCETSGVTALVRIGAERLRENLAFIPVDINDQRRVEFGLVREGGGWRVLSVGILLFNLRELARQWAAAAGSAPRGGPASSSGASSRSAGGAGGATNALLNDEDRAIADLQRLRGAILKFHRAFEEWPQKLEQLGPPPGREGVSPDHAKLVDEELAAGRKSNYIFTYSFVPAAKPGAGAKPSPQSGAQTTPQDSFILTATPAEYGDGARRSFYVDAAGTLRAADKQGAPATAADPVVSATQP